MTSPASRQAFEQATSYFLSRVESVRPEQWDRPGLGVWTVRDLVGHTTRALLTVESYLEQPAPDTIGLETATDYWLAALASPYAVPEQVAERGRQAGAALGPDPLAAVRQAVERVLPLVARTDDAQLLATPFGGMRLRDYLSTRAFELVVHSLDLATALGQPLEPPAESLSEALALAASLAARRGSGPAVLLALTGRASLPAGFSLL